jgi:hypothetical protein
MLRELPTGRIAAWALSAGLALSVIGLEVAAVAAPTLAQEERQGEEIAESVRAGDRRCADLSADDFELIGEYAMGRFLGDEGAHAAMNKRMTLMMGEAGERRMHVALGYRYSGCSGGPASGWVGSMAGMMGGRGSDGYPGTMMGFAHHDGDVSALGDVLIAHAAGALGAGVALLVVRRQPGRSAS